MHKYVARTVAAKKSTDQQSLQYSLTCTCINNLIASIVLTKECIWIVSSREATTWTKNCLLHSQLEDDSGDHQT